MRIFILCVYDIDKLLQIEIVKFGNSRAMNYINEKM